MTVVEVLAILAAAVISLAFGFRMGWRKAERCSVEFTTGIGTRTVVTTYSGPTSGLQGALDMHTRASTAIEP